VKRFVTTDGYTLYLVQWPVSGWLWADDPEMAKVDLTFDDKDGNPIDNQGEFIPGKPSEDGFPDPVPSPGYGFTLARNDWADSDPEEWDTEIMIASDLVDAVFVGVRWMDGLKYNVWHLVATDEFLAQLSKG